MQTKRQAQELVNRFEALIESYVGLLKGSVSQLTRVLGHSKGSGVFDLDARGEQQ